MKILTALVVVSTCLLVVKGSLKDFLNRKPGPIEVQTPQRQSVAVEVNGGDSEAENLAKTYGFVNRGQVGNLMGVYHFEVSSSEEGVAKMIKRLEADPRVIGIELQTHRNMVPKTHN